MKRRLPNLRLLLFLSGISVWLGALPAYGQTSAKNLKPVTKTYALTDVHIIKAPGQDAEMGHILIKDGLIVASGKDIKIPADAQIIKADSMYVYAGFIDGLSNTGIPKPKAATTTPGQRDRSFKPGSPPNDKAGIQPERKASDMLNAKDKSIATMRALGFTTAHVVPHGNMLPGSGTIIQLSGDMSKDMVLQEKAGLFTQFKSNRGIYPGTTIGILAKWRQLYRQAELTQQHTQAYESNPNGMKRPENDPVLEAFYGAIDQKQAVFFKTEKFLEAYRAMALQKDLGFPLVLAGLKDGWELTSQLKSAQIPVLLSLDLPKEIKDKKKKPAKKGSASVEEPTLLEKEKAALEKRKAEAYKLHCSQAAAFEKAGISFGFTSLGASAKNIQKHLGTMIKHGLSEEAALAALTTNPAKMLGLDKVMGTVEKGKIANLVVSNKPYFEEKSQVRYVFVDGTLYTYDAKSKKKSSGTTDKDAIAKVVGSWSYTAETPGGSSDGMMIFKNDNGTLSGTLSNSQAEGDAREMEDIEVNGNEVTFSMTVEGGGQTMEIEVELTLTGTSFEGSMNVGQFGSFTLEGSKESGDPE